MIAQPLHERSISFFVKDITGRAPGKHSGLDPKRARSFNYPVVQDYFKKLRDILSTEDIPWGNIYNMDEKGAQLGGGRKVRRRKYLFGQNSRQRYRIRSSNLELVTVAERASADGHALRPYIIFKGKRLSPAKCCQCCGIGQRLD